MNLESRSALIAMSGGVDSSVAAYQMQQAGYRCVGATMRLYDGQEAATQSCCSLEDVEDARSVAARIGIPYYVFNFKEDFSSQVIDRFVHAYEAGATPNPCIDCNRYLKFDRMHRRARELGLEYVVTGHYARITRENGRFLLKKGLDAGKDQSYVLYMLTQEQLAHTLLPLGELHKEQVRAIAEAQGFLNARKRDSQDICFVPDGDYAAFIRRQTGKAYAPGDFVDPQGHVLGRHRGIICYTVGQRRGLGVSGGRPLYVKEIRPEENVVVLADDRELYENTLVAQAFNWISMEAPQSPIRVLARARYHHPEQPATAQVLPDGQVRIVFDQPQRALTKGQAVVLYQGDTVVGGGRIDQVYST